MIDSNEEKKEIEKQTRLLEKKINSVYRSGGVQKAIEACQSALLKDPTNPRLRIRLGDLYLEWHLDISQIKSYIDEAIVEYQRALESYLNEPEVYYKIGYALYHKNEIEKAINYFEIAIEKEPSYADAYYMIAECYRKKARVVLSLEYARKAVKVLKFRNAKAHLLIFQLLRFSARGGLRLHLSRLLELLLFLLELPFDKIAKKNVCKVVSYVRFVPMLIRALIAVKRRNIEGALQIYRDAVEKAPGFVSMYLLLGDIYKALGRYEDALTEYKMAIWLDSMNVAAYSSLCCCYEDMGEYEQAVSIYKKLIEFQPDIAEFHGRLASLQAYTHEIPEAITHFQSAISLNSNRYLTSTLATELGYIFQELEQNLDAAISTYQVANMATPEDMESYINLGSAYYDKGEYDNALSVYRKALALNSCDARIHCNLGYLHWGKGDIDDAIKEYELAIRYHKKYDIAYNNLGVIYLDDLGHVKKAEEMFKKAIDCNPNYALAYYNLARATAIMGDKIEAAKLYQYAMNINNVTQEMDPREISDRIQGLFD